MPRLGGIALFLGIIVPSLAFLPLGGEMRGILLGATVATTVGAIDDFRGLRWWEKLGGQVLAASIPCMFGVWIHRFTFPSSACTRCRRGSGSRSRSSRSSR